MVSMLVRPLSREEARGIDKKAAEEMEIPTILLMENAGRGAAEEIARAIGEGRSRGDRVLILCGPGNNGGDGAVVARFLDLWGFNVKVVWFADPKTLKGDAATQWRILDRSGIDQSSWQVDAATDRDRHGATIAEADAMVDGLLGTGLTRPVEGIFREAIETLNASGKPVFALDLPSGLDADRGIAMGTAVIARMTITFVAPKLGFRSPEAANFLGEVIVVEIGAPRRLLEPFRA